MLQGDSSLHHVVVERASYSTITFGKDAQRVPGIIIRMALSDKTPSSTAVLRSCLALASFHRDNALQTTARSKIAALRALSESTQGFIGVNESVCHIAAGIILCTLEVRMGVRSLALALLILVLDTTKFDNIEPLAMVCLWRHQNRESSWP
jgi:hypothetical protein